MTLKPCGTPAALRRHYKRGEEPDAACRAAGAGYKRTMRAGRSAAQDIRLAHRIKTAHPDLLASAVVQLLTDPRVTDHTRGVVSTALIKHLNQGDPMTTTAPNRTLTNAGRRELDRGNLAIALHLPVTTPMPELLDRVRDFVAEREAFDLGRLQADLAAHVDQATGLAYFLAEQLGEHVDDQGEETQIQTVKRLLVKVRAEAS